MERIKIDKERTWIFSPVNQIVIKAEIRGAVSEERLKAAIRAAVNQYDMLHQRIVLDGEGNAFYEKMEGFQPVMEPLRGDWQKAVTEQQKIPLRINEGEFIRFFYSLSASGAALLIIAHHIAGDGISFTYFLQDIMRSLSGEKIEHKALELFNLESLPEDTGLRAPIKWLINYMNRKWKKTGRKFDFREFSNMSGQYWNSHDTLIYTYCLEDEDYDAICRYSKENKVTINTLITAALIRASGELCDTGMAVSIRDKNFTGMGNYASGISVKYQYKERLQFLENSERLQKHIYDKLEDASKKYFLLQFMRSIEPTLQDAVYFQACGDYRNKTAGTFSKMFGYSGNPKGISITNLTKLPIEIKYGAYEITDFIFIPPLVLNAKRIIGGAAFGRKMVLSLHIRDDAYAEEHRKFFYKGMDYLKSL